MYFCLFYIANLWVFLKRVALLSNCAIALCLCLFHISSLSCFYQQSQRIEQTYVDILRGLFKTFRLERLWNIHSYIRSDS